MSISCNQLVIQRHGRTVALQAYTDAHYYAALRAFGAREARAAAAAKGLITIKIKTN